MITKEKKQKLVDKIKDFHERRDNLTEKEVDDMNETQQEWMDDTIQRAKKITAIREGHVRFTPKKKKRIKRNRPSRGKK